MEMGVKLVDRGRLCNGATCVCRLGRLLVRSPEAELWVQEAVVEHVRVGDGDMRAT